MGKCCAKRFKIQLRDAGRGVGPPPTSILVATLYAAEIDMWFGG